MARRSRTAFPVTPVNPVLCRATPEQVWNLPVKIQKCYLKHRTADGGVSTPAKMCRVSWQGSVWYQPQRWVTTRPENTRGGGQRGRGGSQHPEPALQRETAAQLRDRGTSLCLKYGREALSWTRRLLSPRSLPSRKQGTASSAPSLRRGASHQPTRAATGPSRQRRNETQLRHALVPLQAQQGQGPWVRSKGT